MELTSTFHRIPLNTSLIWGRSIRGSVCPQTHLWISAELPCLFHWRGYDMKGSWRSRNCLVNPCWPQGLRTNRQFVFVKEVSLCQSTAAGSWTVSWSCNETWTCAVWRALGQLRRLCLVCPNGSDVAWRSSEQGHVRKSVSQSCRRLPLRFEPAWLRVVGLWIHRSSHRHYSSTAWKYLLQIACLPSSMFFSLYHFIHGLL